jgi:hypothetical protein
VRTRCASDRSRGKICRDHEREDANKASERSEQGETADQKREQAVDSSSCVLSRGPPSLQRRLTRCFVICLQGSQGDRTCTSQTTPPLIDQLVSLEPTLQRDVRQSCTYRFTPCARTAGRHAQRASVRVATTLVCHGIFRSRRLPIFGGGWKNLATSSKSLQVQDQLRGDPACWARSWWCVRVPSQCLCLALWPSRALYIHLRPPKRETLAQLTAGGGCICTGDSRKNRLQYIARFVFRIALCDFLHVQLAMQQQRAGQSQHTRTRTHKKSINFRSKP